MNWFKVKIDKINKKAINYLSFKKLIEILISFIQKEGYHIFIEVSSDGKKKFN